MKTVYMVKADQTGEDDWADVEYAVVAYSTKEAAEEHARKAQWANKERVNTLVKLIDKDGWFAAVNQLENSANPYDQYDRGAITNSKNYYVEELQVLDTLDEYKVP